MGWWGWPRLAALIADHCLCVSIIFHRRGNNITGTEWRGPVPCCCRLPQAVGVISSEWRLREWRRVPWPLSLRSERNKGVTPESWSYWQDYPVWHYYLKQTSVQPKFIRDQLIFQPHVSCSVRIYQQRYQNIQQEVFVYLQIIFVFCRSQLFIAVVSFPWELGCVLKRPGLHYCSKLKAWSLKLFDNVWFKFEFFHKPLGLNAAITGCLCLDSCQNYNLCDLIETLSWL